MPDVFWSVRSHPFIKEVTMSIINTQVQPFKTQAFHNASSSK